MDPRASDIPLEKRRLRQQVRAALAAMDPEDAALKSAAICRHLIAAPFFAAARVILTFDPMLGPGGEVDIRPALAKCLQLGKRLCIPRIDWSTGALTPALVEDLDKDLIPAARPGAAAAGASSGSGGGGGVAGRLRQPRPDAPTIELCAIDAILVPGLAFDHAGNRLGRGEGFYDRFLAQDELVLGGATTCGVAYSLMVLPSIPRTKMDVPVDAIATEMGIVNVGG